MLRTVLDMKMVGLWCGYLLSLGFLSACTQPPEQSEQVPDKTEISQPSPTPSAELPVALPEELPPLSSSGNQLPPEANASEDTTHIAVTGQPQDPRVSSPCGQDHIYEAIKTLDYQIYICLNQTNQTDPSYRYVGIENKSGSKVVLPAQTSGEYYAFSYEAVSGDTTYKIATNPKSLQDARLIITQGNQQLLSQSIEQRELILD